MCVCEDIYAAEICISADNTFCLQSDGEMHVPHQVFESRGVQSNLIFWIHQVRISTQVHLHAK